MRWFAFLRGMNLGRRRTTNEALVEAVAACGCEDVEAYQASGNVVFGDPRARGEVAGALEHGLEARLGYPVATFLRSAAEIRALADSAPFTPEELAAGDGRRQVVLLQASPSDEIVEAAMRLVPPGERLVAAGTALHWLPAAGLSDSALDLRRLDELTGGTTIRTHATIQRLAAKFL